MQHDAALRESVAAALRRFPARTLPDGTHGRAAVALVITHAGLGADWGGLPHHARWSTEAALVLTRRAGHLRRHANQWALPGGRIDGNETPEQAALRELREEVALHLPPESVLGRLDDFSTRSGFAITPVVLWADDARAMVANADEVASIHRIALKEFMRPDVPMLEQGAHAHPVLRMPVGDSWIAAPTAAFLYQFREVCLLGRDTRVAHFEQPDFAWR
jgi:8-oxo-dGTP pyrophosphatase MutT (NUDIX family)